MFPDLNTISQLSGAVCDEPQQRHRLHSAVEHERAEYRSDNYLVVEVAYTGSRVEH